MAAEAVIKIDSAEKKGNNMIKKAREDALDIVVKAEADAAKNRENIIENAYKTKEEIIEAAKIKASGESFEAAVHYTDEKKLERAINLVVERFVS